MTSRRLAILPPLAAHVTGLAVLGVAFASVRQEPTVEGQQGWAALAVLAVIVSGAGNAWALVIGRRTVAERRRRLLGTGIAAPAFTAATAEGSWLTAPGMTRYHRPACPLLDGKATRPALLDTVAATRLSPCDWCQP